MNVLKIAAALTVIAGSAFAESHASGDAANGETLFARQCVACHVVADAEGEVLAGRNAKVGPNLFGIAGATPGTVEDFRYGDAIVAAGETGAVFDEATFVAYTMDPTAWLRDVTEDARARSKMSFKVRSETDAADLYAYLATFAPAAE
ncbi:c-type cytochrome [Octadecabacter sp. R77987]|uniref:c-type cytochrome n=1 Tax=Octadecabacter sp. R77987 TaxID=3093874 RepID=UPI0036710DE5